MLVVDFVRCCGWHLNVLFDSIALTTFDSYWWRSNFNCSLGKLKKVNYRLLIFLIFTNIKLDTPTIIVLCIIKNQWKTGKWNHLFPTCNIQGHEILYFTHISNVRMCAYAHEGGCVGLYTRVGEQKKVCRERLLDR